MKNVKKPSASTVTFKGKKHKGKHVMKKMIKASKKGK